MCLRSLRLISRKDRKHRLENMFLKLSSYGLFSMWVVIVNIDLSQEIFAIDMSRALKSSLKHRRKNVLRPLQLYGDQALLDAIYTEISSTMKQFGLEKVPVSVTCYHLAKLITMRLISATVA